jgi:hypothetical protein
MNIRHLILRIAFPLGVVFGAGVFLARNQPKTPIETLAGLIALLLASVLQYVFIWILLEFVAPEKPKGDSDQ